MIKRPPGLSARASQMLLYPPRVPISRIREAPASWASSMSILPWLGDTLIEGSPAASLALSAASSAGSRGSSRSVVYWSTAVHNSLSIETLLNDVG